MFKSNRNTVFLYLTGFLLIAGSFFVSDFSVSFEGEESLIVNKIRKNIYSEAIYINELISKTEAKITSSKLSFNDLMEESKYPFFVFKSDSLIFWSSHNYIPNAQKINSKNSQQLLLASTGKYIAFKKEVNANGNSYKIISLLQLSYKFPISNKYLKSSLNSDIFPLESISINSYKSEYNLFTGEGFFLFSVEFLEKYIAINNYSLAILIIGVLLLLIGFIFQVYPNLKDRNPNFKMSLFLLLIGNKSKWFASSMGNVFLLFILGIFSLSLLVGLYCYSIYVYDSEAFTLDINKFFISLSFVKTVAFAGFLAISIIYFYISHVTVKYWHLYKSKINYARALSLGLGLFLVAGLFSFFTEINVIFISLLHLLYLAMLLYLRLPSTLSRVRYVTYMYFFICTLVCSITYASAYHFWQRKNLSHYSEKIAKKIIKNGRFADESLFYEVVNSISQDKFIQSIISSPFGYKSLIDRKITKFYLKESAEKYEVKTYLFDIKGNSMDANPTRNYFSILNSLDNADYKTSFKNIYRQRGSNPVYFCSTKLKNEQNIIEGYLLIELRVKKIIPYSIMPELVMSKNESDLAHTIKYSYAIFDNDNLVSTFGNYNYQKSYKVIGPILKVKLNKGIEEDFIIQHQLVHFQDNKDVLVSVNMNVWKNTLSNFSFIFLLSAFLLAFVIISNTFYYKLRQVSSTFTTKIQLFINFAFFIPLFVISIAVFYMISYSYKNELENNFVERSENAASALMQKFSKPIVKEDFTQAMLENLYETARFSSSDINIYDNTGKLIAASQSVLFEKGIISERLNPEAIISLIQQKENYVLLTEKIGTLKFNTVYHQIKSVKTGEMTGIMAIPFFGSDKEIQSKIIDTLLVIINIFTVLFLVFLIASFAASRWLTSPLSMLTKKIKQTTLSKDNEPLSYQSKDEIGILVNEYNLMLKKLAESKKALSISEKESAWREMAKQVAHEIKNPLTPMKLKLQNLHRVLKKGDSDTVEYTEKTIETLLEQIDNLTDIANSFSVFAQMPIPIKEKIEMVDLLRKTMFLYQSNEQNLEISFDCSLHEAWVEGDSKLLTRIFINLIANALEAVKSISKPCIIIKLEESEGNLIIEVKDNGVGIVLEVQNKIFNPNFSTKNTGSGIGLAVAKRGLEQMNGKIWVHSTIGLGSSFYVQMPVLRI